MIPYGRQTIEKDDIQAVVNVLKSDWLTTGPKVEEFEKAFAEYVGAKYAISFSNGTAALHGAVSSIKKSHNRDEIITTPMTFAATANSILYSDLVPVFVDVEEDTLLIDPQKVESAITEKTIAIIAVDYAGQPCNYDALREIAYKHTLILIADACHSLGAAYKDKKVGTLADMTIFSFHPVKVMTTGEGGMITTDIKSIAEFLKAFRNHGRQSSDMNFLGFNYRLTDIQCALGLSQLRKVDTFVKIRKDIAKDYHDWFRFGNRIIPLFIKEDSAYHLYVVKVENRDVVIKAFTEAGIATVIHYPLVYKHKYYQDRFDANCPIAEKVSKQILSLPIYPTLRYENQLKVISNLF